MTPIASIEERLDLIVQHAGADSSADELLQLGERALTAWIEAKDACPTDEKREGFRLLALQRQGAVGDPSFNACRETCRELAYHYNLITHGDTNPQDTSSNLHMMSLVANHLCLFISGKMQTAQLGEFCCSSKPIHDEPNDLSEISNA